MNDSHKITFPYRIPGFLDDVMLQATIHQPNLNITIDGVEQEGDQEVYISSSIFRNLEQNFQDNLWDAWVDFIDSTCEDVNDRL